jgi:hypothetical protein
MLAVRQQLHQYVEDEGWIAFYWINQSYPEGDQATQTVQY